MCGTRHVLHRRRLGNRDVLQRIEKLDRHLKFFVKELAHVGHSGTAATNDSLNSLAIAAVIALPPRGMLRKKILPDSMKRMFVVRAPISSNNEQSPASG